MTQTLCDICRSPVTRSLVLPIDHHGEQVSFTLWIHPGTKLDHVHGAVCLECGWSTVRSVVEPMLPAQHVQAVNECE